VRTVGGGRKIWLRPIVNMLFLLLLLLLMMIMLLLLLLLRVHSILLWRWGLILRGDIALRGCVLRLRVRGVLGWASVQPILLKVVLRSSTLRCVTYLVYCLYTVCNNNCV